MINRISNSNIESLFLPFPLRVKAVFSPRAAGSADARSGSSGTY
jgi:hypothetical protein